MQYREVVPGIFLERPNRFIAQVKTEDGTQTVHVKNTGRCKELLIPGTTVYLERATNPLRKTAYDLIAVEKDDLLINMDAQAPNRVFAEWVKEGNLFPDIIGIKPEAMCGHSRLDFALETKNGTYWVEVKGVTLEEAGDTYFPDAPTERGVKHLRELQQLAEKGERAAVFFVIQMAGAKSFAPNERTHPAFAAALRSAAAAGVQVFAYDCQVTPDSVSISRSVPVVL